MEKYKDIELISFIPARGGSKRVPGKNIKMIAGKPMMVWTIEACLKSKYVSRTYVSTEDSEVKEIALKAGALVHDRPKKYAEDKNIELLGGIQHFREMIWADGYKFLWCVWLNPNYVMRQSRHIDEAYELLVEKGGWKVASMLEKRYPTSRFYKNINSDGLTKFAFKWDTKELSHPVVGPKTYINESLVVITPFYCSQWDVNGPGTLAYVCSEEDCVEVDSPLDFKVAEILLKERIAREKKDG